MNKKRIAIIIGILIAAAFLIFVGMQIHKKVFVQKVTQGDPIDIVMDFYSPWLQAMQSTSTTPYAEGLQDTPYLGKDLRKQLIKTEGEFEDGLDPVLCQSIIPMRLTTRKIYEEPEHAQVLVMAKEKELTNQAVVTLKKLNEGWYIDAIECSLGEIPPEREFSFEREGELIKGSLPDPYNRDYWHIMYEENGQAGLYAPLFFNEESRCISKRGDEYVCDPTQFEENTKITVRAQLTEWGAEVKRLEFR